MERGETETEDAEANNCEKVQEDYEFKRKQ